MSGPVSAPAAAGRSSCAVVVAAAVAGLAGYVFVYAATRAELPIRSDGFSYYVYLPSWFIFHDPSLSATARDCCGGDYPEFTAIVRWPGTRRWVNAHPIGVAVMQTPFFLMADALTRWSNLSRDGFTFYYQHAAGVSGLFWTVVGLWFLRRLLLRHYTDRVTAATLLALLLGTNLYHYATFDSSYSHAYAFCLIAAYLDLLDRWYDAPRPGDGWKIGLVAGLIVLVRHTNALVLVTLPLYGLARGGWRRVSSLGRERRRDLQIAALVAILVVAPQLGIYYQATGRILVSSYGRRGFHFGSPQIVGVLFGVTKGLFFWSPLLLLAVAGLPLTRGPVRAFLLPALVVFALDTYLIASWWDWQFGASYGHRGCVDIYPLLAIGLAAFFTRAAERPAARTVVACFVVGAVALSLVQMFQYWNGVLPMSDTTWDRYREIFLRLR